MNTCRWVEKRGGEGGGVAVSDPTYMEVRGGGRENVFQLMQEEMPFSSKRMKFMLATESCLAKPDSE